LADKKNTQNNYPIPRTMSEFIYQNLKKSILNNEFKADEWINEVHIAEEFSVSRTPVREAVRRLAAEGFVQIDSHKKAKVKEVSYEEISEIFQVLGLLDSAAISIAAESLTLTDFGKLEKAIANMEKYGQIDTIEKYLEHNVAFHNVIWESIPNKLLREIIFSVRDKMHRYKYARIYAFQKAGVLARSKKQHKAIKNQLKSKNTDKLRDLIIEHWASVFELPAYTKGLKEILNIKK
jgi:DNA-binding GntR family transcriptional regulator